MAAVAHRQLTAWRAGWDSDAPWSGRGTFRQSTGERRERYHCNQCETHQAQQLSTLVSGLVPASCDPGLATELFSRQRRIPRSERADVGGFLFCSDSFTEITTACPVSDNFTACFRNFSEN